MKSVLSTIIVMSSLFIFACTPQTTVLETMPTVTRPIIAETAQVSSTVVEMPSATDMPLAAASATAENGTESASGSALPAVGVTLSENGKTFVMHVGESFLLDLGMDVYDWTVEVDHQDVLHRELNVAVIRGAQGIYIAKSPGTAILTASGNPLCLQSNPPCKMPSLLFRVTMIVK